MAITTVQTSLSNPSSDWRIPRSIALSLVFFAAGCVIGRYVFGFGASWTFICGLTFFAIFCVGIVEYVRFYGTRPGEDSSANSKSSPKEE